MIKTRCKFLKPGDVCGKRTILGCEFKVNKIWHVVCKCECGSIDIVALDQIKRNKTCKTCHRIIPPKINVGQKIGNLTIESAPYYDFKKKNNNWTAKAICECGWSGNILIKRHISGRTKYHKNCKFYYGNGENSHCWDGYKKISGTFWSKLKRLAHERKIEFSITIEDCWEKLKEQNNKCALTGWDLIFKSSGQKGNASLDRIDSKKGYILSNIQWVHKDVNMSKGCLDNQYYIDLCYIISNNKKIFKTQEIILYTNRKNFKGVGNISFVTWNSIKSGAEKRKLEFNISKEEIWELYVKQNGRCNITGVPIYFKLPGYGYKNYFVQDGESTASLDRIDSSKGYISNNIQWVHKHVNLMKFNFNTDYFYSLCFAISKNKTPSKNVNDMLMPKNFTIIKNNTRQLCLDRAPKNNYKGICYNKLARKFNASIMCHGFKFNLGNFNNEKDAAQNYDYYAIKLFNNCYLNFPNFDYSNFIPQKIINIDASKFQKQKDGNVVKL